MAAPLESRPYKLKNPSYNCFCPLCRTERQMKYRKNLSWVQYAQLIFASAVATYFLFPVMKEKSVFLFFILWPTLEITNKILYRKELSCPYCGFDATWYRRDVKIARRKVQDFWDKKSLESQSAQ